LEQIRRL
jgi:hypothetical protein